MSREEEGVAWDGEGGESAGDDGEGAGEGAEGEDEEEGEDVQRGVVAADGGAAATCRPLTGILTTGYLGVKEVEGKACDAVCGGGWLVGSTACDGLGLRGAH